MSKSYEDPDLSHLCDLTRERDELRELSAQLRTQVDLHNRWQERAERAERERDEWREKYLMRDKPAKRCRDCGDTIVPWRDFCVPCGQKRISDD